MSLQSAQDQSTYLRCALGHVDAGTFQGSKVSQGHFARLQTEHPQRLIRVGKGSSNFTPHSDKLAEKG